MSELIGNESVTTPSIFQELVGDDRKYKTPDDLAAGKLEADRYILELKEENERLKAEQAKADHAAELLKKLQEDKASEGSPSTPADVNDSTNNSPTSESLSEEDLKALVKATLSETQSAAEEVKNVNTVNEALIKAYGDGEKAKEAIQSKAKELNVTTEYLEDVAKGNPAVFFKLISDGTPQSTSNFVPNAFRSEANTDRGQVKDWAYYSKLRKENPSLYRTPAIIKEMDDQIVKLGSDKFYNR